MSNMISILAIGKMMQFLLQEKSETNNGNEKKDELFVQSIMGRSTNMFVCGIARPFCFSITLYQDIRLRFLQYYINKDLFSRSQ